MISLLTESIYEEPIGGWMQQQHNCTGGNLGADNALELKIPVCGHQADIAKDTRHRIPAQW